MRCEQKQVNAQYNIFGIKYGEHFYRKKQRKIDFLNAFIYFNLITVIQYY